MNFNDRETAMILAALRYWQDQVQEADAKETMPEHFLDVEPMTDKEIDGLCERINCAEPCKPKDKPKVKPKVTTNQEQGLYVIPEGKGFTCLGFDRCLELIKAYAADLGLEVDPANTERGSMAAYQYWQLLGKAICERHNATGQRSNAELTPQLIGLEGKRVEVVDCYGETRRFWVGKSIGVIPIHLEVDRRDSTGGGGVTGAPFKSVRVIENHK